MLAYRDQTHITATFSKTLAPYLVRAVETGLGGGPVSSASKIGPDEHS